MGSDFVPRPIDEAQASALARELGVHPVTARCLLSRGIGSPDGARAFLQPRLDALRPPDGLAGLDSAIPRLVEAIRDGQHIGVFGDYDVDGVTTAALLTEALRAFGATVSVRVADRVAGYGFGAADAQALLDVGCRLIITGDCGTSDEVALLAARQAGADVIVIDHHTVPDHERPHPSHSLINPFRVDSTFPFRGMASVGLAFYVMAALRSALRSAGAFGKSSGSDWPGRTCTEPDPRSWLDLVALGTVADLVPLHGENRILTRAGLRQLTNRHRPGVAALLEFAGVKAGDEVDERTVGWKLGPRLNAPGRLGAAQPALDLLLARDAHSAQAAAHMVETLNHQRRAEQERAYLEALAMLGETPEGPAIVIAGQGWAPGVVGIVAARLVDRFQRPAFVVAAGAEGEARGSARSFGGVHLYEALHAARGCLDRYGGHAAAAGFSLDVARMDELRTALFDFLGNDEVGSRSEVAVDAVVDARELSEALAQELSALAPFGKGNEEPLLFSSSLEVRETRRVGDGSHLKLVLRDGGGRELSAIAFGLGELDPGAGAHVDVAYVPGISTWGGRRRIELNVRDLRVCPPVVLGA